MESKDDIKELLLEVTQALCTCHEAHWARRMKWEFNEARERSTQKLNALLERVQKTLREKT